MKTVLSRNREVIEDMMSPIEKKHSQPQMKIRDDLNEDSDDAYGMK